MRKSFLIVLVLSVTLWGYVKVNQKIVCEDPIEITVGMFDERFNISRANFLSALEEASLVWENALRKDLFAYEPNPSAPNFLTPFTRYLIRRPVIVNLIYDERQMFSEEHRSLVSEVRTTKESADAIKAEFATLQNRHKQESFAYQNLLAQYRKRQASYTEVEAKRQEVNELAEKINALVRQYNSLVGVVNSTVETINEYAGVEFEEGLYISDREGERIEIYEFGDRAALVRVLAHELGHVLGIEHNENPKSIMYYLNTSENMEPTEEDIASALAVCRGR